MVSSTISDTFRKQSRVSLIDWNGWMISDCVNLGRAASSLPQNDILERVSGSRLLPNLLLILRGLFAKVFRSPKSGVRYVTIRSASPKGMVLKTIPSVLRSIT